MSSSSLDRFGPYTQTIEFDTTLVRGPPNKHITGGDSLGGKDDARLPPGIGMTPKKAVEELFSNKAFMFGIGVVALLYINSRR